MIVILSPAKTLKFTPINFKIKTGVPVFLAESALLMNRLREYSVDEVADMMSISPVLARLNVERFQRWSMPFNSKNATPALWTFMGDVYEGLNAATFSKSDAEFAQSTIRILSGLYGVLHPFDLMQPYRLEMGTRLEIDGKPNLYRFWDKTIANYLLQEMKTRKENVVVNLASVEYFKSVESLKESVRVITPSFYETKSGKPKMVSIYAKRARGLMTRFITTERITVPEYVKAFDMEGYCFSEPLSQGDSWAFVR